MQKTKAPQRNQNKTQLSDKLQAPRLQPFAKKSTTQRRLPTALHSAQRKMSTTPQQPPSANSIRVGLCQMKVTPNKDKNWKNAEDAVASAVEKGAKLVVLPECFQCPYDTGAFPLYQEEIPEPFTPIDPTTHPTTNFLSKLAAKHAVYLVGGSIPEKAHNPVTNTNAIYNCSTVFNSKGEVIAKHRKAHLFDINIPGKITFRESDSLTPGNQVTTFTIPTAIEHGIMLNKDDSFRDHITVGLGICYDIRFAEYALVARQHYNADLLVYPGAFNMTTGPAHWQLLQQARALDNQLYVLACSPARADPNDPENVDASGKRYAYTAWGHSTVVSPWGEVLGTTEHEQDIVIADLDFNFMDGIRQNIPISSQKRTDLYQLGSQKQ